MSSELPKFQKDEQKARNALLADIQQGTRLRKVTQTNDRSAPQIESKYLQEGLGWALQQPHLWRSDGQDLCGFGVHLWTTSLGCERGGLHFLKVHLVLRSTAINTS